MSDTNAVIVVKSTDIDIFCYLTEIFFPNNTLSHWLLHGHMSSNIKNCSPTLRLRVLKLQYTFSRSKQTFLCSSSASANNFLKWRMVKKGQIYAWSTHHDVLVFTIITSEEQWKIKTNKNSGMANKNINIFIISGIEYMKRRLFKARSFLHDRAYPIFVQTS